MDSSKKTTFGSNELFVQSLVLIIWKYEQIPWNAKCSTTILLSCCPYWETLGCHVNSFVSLTVWFKDQHSAPEQLHDIRYHIETDTRSKSLSDRNRYWIYETTNSFTKSTNMSFLGCCMEITYRKSPITWNLITTNYIRNYKEISMHYYYCVLWIQDQQGKMGIINLN